MEPDFSNGLNVGPDRHPGTKHFARMFKTGHLSSDGLKDVSYWCCALAQRMVDDLPDGPELTTGLRNLWDAKNNFVMAAVLDGRG